MSAEWWGGGVPRTCCEILRSRSAEGSRDSGSIALRALVIVLVVAVTATLAVALIARAGGAGSSATGSNVMGSSMSHSSGRGMSHSSMLARAMSGKDVPAPGGPHVLDALLYPPAARPYSPDRVRTFRLTMRDEDIEVAKGVTFSAWTYDGTVPGPIIRVTEGDRVRITVHNAGSHPHTAHLHGIHAADQDGVFEIIEPGESYTYEFVAEPGSLNVYHCHAMPLKKHIAKGLYGTFIIDPRTPREPATELVMLMNGFDTDGDGANNFYTVNGKAFYYARYPISVRQGELVRIYLANMTEFDPLNSFHLHGNFFRYYPTGSTRNFQYTDMVALAQGERGIIETRFPFPGRFMFHAHQSEFADLGWMGFFDVKPDGVTPKGQPSAEAMRYQRASAIGSDVAATGGAT